MNRFDIYRSADAGTSCMRFQAIRVPHAKMLTSHLDKIRLDEHFNSQKHMQHNDTISLLKIPVKRWRQRYENENTVLHKLEATWLVHIFVQKWKIAFVLFATSSLPFKHMHRRASAGHLQISDRGVISRKKHALELTGLRILLIHVTQFSPKWAEPLLLSYTYTIIYRISNKSSNYTEKNTAKKHISRLTLRISFWIYAF